MLLKMNYIFTVIENLTPILEIERMPLVATCVWFGMEFSSLPHLVPNIWELTTTKEKLPPALKL